jgi:hypothetical protein
VRALLLTLFLVGGCSYFCPVPPPCPPPVLPELETLPRPELAELKLGRMENGMFLLKPEGREAILSNVALLQNLIERYEAMVTKYNEIVKREANRASPQ